jgi:hypothetical protein
LCNCIVVVLRLLLKYVARDEVALLDRGTGGVPEVRHAIETYEERSPLYGFLQYRRRKVVLKYVPEGISRLLQGPYFLGKPAARDNALCAVSMRGH